ncbi:MAG TPA: methyltransferase domain-containing protein [Acidimicrobiales bacterium]|nr:methyltransferase domain-containing protein [Acidimicrobiales bacterium]
MTSAAAYTATGALWERGPARIYDRLAAVLVGRSPVALDGRRVLDVGAGTGAASRAALAAGAAGVVALDAAYGMLAHEAAARPPAVVGDMLALPFRASAFGAAVAAFSLNHLADPVAGLREMARVTGAGGAVLAATYAQDDDHPVKAAVSAALAARGWAPAPWYRSMMTTVVPLLATAERFAAAAAAAGLDAQVRAVRVPFPELDAMDLVAWRFGMVQHAPFVAGLPDAERRAVVTDALDLLGDEPAPLVRSVLVLTAVRV